MRKFILLSLLLTASVWTYAQDIIVLKNAEEIQAKVITVGQDEITYKKWDFTEGPTYSLKKTDIFVIKYSNGTKDVMFNEVVTPTREKTPRVTNKFSSAKQPTRYIDRVMFNGYTEFGCVFNSYWVFPAVNFSFGARIYDYGYVGFGPGLEYVLQSEVFSVPILFSFRGMYPVKEDVSPYLDFSVGPDLLIDLDGYCAVFARINLVGGIELKRFVVGLGYNYIGGAHCGLFRIGVRMGQMR